MVDWELTEDSLVLYYFSLYLCLWEPKFVFLSSAERNCPENRSRFRIPTPENLLNLVFLSVVLRKSREKKGPRSLKFCKNLGGWGWGFELAGKNVLFGITQRKFLWVRRGCQASQRNGWPPGKSGEPPGKSGKLPGKSGKLPGNLWIAIQFHSERTSGEVAENFRGSSGNFRGSPGTFQKFGGAWLPPSDSPNLSPNYKRKVKRKVGKTPRNAPDRC